jgi:hypothetical protein
VEDDGIDFRLREGVGEFESCQMEIWKGHEPQPLEVSVTGLCMASMEVENSKTATWGRQKARTYLGLKSTILVEYY